MGCRLNTALVQPDVGAALQIRLRLFSILDGWDISERRQEIRFSKLPASRTLRLDCSFSSDDSCGVILLFLGPLILIFFFLREDHTIWPKFELYSSLSETFTQSTAPDTFQHLRSCCQLPPSIVPTH